jgi:hypothetical protein
MGAGERTDCREEDAYLPASDTICGRGGDVGSISPQTGEIGREYFVI